MIRGRLLPLIVAAIAVPLAAAFVLVGPQLGLALGALAVAALIIIAARMTPRMPIEAPVPDDDLRHILVVTTQELDGPGAIEQIARSVHFAESDTAEVVILAPAEESFLDRWASDVSRSWAEAQRKLVISSASLGKAAVPVRAKIGDADVVLAVEDTLRTYPATEVFLVTGPPESDRAGARAARELATRLNKPLSMIVLAGV